MRRFVVLVLLSLGLAACATAPSDSATAASQSPRGRYSAESGESPVGVIPDVLLRDESRKRDLRLTIEYPTRGGDHPLVVFSTGFAASRASYVGLTSHWASHSYVVIRVSHPEGDATQRTQALSQDWSSQTPADWRNRARDLSFVLDSLGALAQRYPELEGKIDVERIGVGGHSYGALSALMAGGARLTGETVAADPRVKALVVMSPPGPDGERLTRDSFTGLRLPVLFITGSRDTGVTEAQTPEWRAEAFRAAPAGDKWLAMIEGARHASFTGRVDDLIEAQAREREIPATAPVPGDPRLPTTPQPLPRGQGQGVMASSMLRERDVFNSARVLSLAFWDAYLRGEASGLEALERQRGGVTIERR